MVPVLLEVRLSGGQGEEQRSWRDVRALHLTDPLAAARREVALADLLDPIHAAETPALVQRVAAAVGVVDALKVQIVKPLAGRDLPVVLELVLVRELDELVLRVPGILPVIGDLEDVCRALVRCGCAKVVVHDHPIARATGGQRRLGVHLALKVGQKVEVGGRHAALPIRLFSHRNPSLTCINVESK